MNEMIERVAEALWRSSSPLPRMMPDDWQMWVGDKRPYRKHARAAIEAMREPTDAMVDSCGNGECAKWARGAWYNYIDAALSEEKQPA